MLTASQLSTTDDVLLACPACLVTNSLIAIFALLPRLRLRCCPPVISLGFVVAASYSSLSLLCLSPAPARKRAFQCDRPCHPGKKSGRVALL
ncbi:hypothetical protein GGS23DRAFT_481609 [Durotheca rogersii]|uniref:uncharacterized protein n=1 Tax=Durotheca rogersii TaxID=419775 RepID=UPI00222032CB|nr:uncharacterized protein GGS23DRAFT_481609 [Durotheca rogersii]KAI5864083.1 hypothetical protein GGS23DRAFT_481609 [Durotheca rogersii]